MPAKNSISRACLTCGIVKMVQPNVIAKGGGKFCGRACYAASITTHGESQATGDSTEYRIWHTMKERCLNPNATGYATMYGGRGITICPEWRDSFEQFLADMGRWPSPGHSLDRIDNERGYEPGNVRWSTRSEQARNRRSNRLLTFNGETRCVAEWADVVGLTTTCILGRIKLGWPVERILTTPEGANRRTLTLGDETLGIAEWSRRTGIHRGVIHQRIRMGWSVERTLTAPVRPMNVDRHSDHESQPPLVIVSE
jgi:hypothetical protein